LKKELESSKADKEKASAKVRELEHENEKLKKSGGAAPA